MMKMNKAMKHLIYNIVAVAILTAVFVSCTTTRQASVSVTPSASEPISVGNDRRATVDLLINIPAQTIARRSRLIITPELLAADSTSLGLLTPVVLDASIYRKKMRRRVMMEHYVDDYAQYAQPIDRKKAQSIAWTDTFQLPEPHTLAYVSAALSNDGCGSCHPMSERLPMATLVYEPVDTTPKYLPLNLQWMDPRFEVQQKVMRGEGTAHMQFIINKYDIVPSLGNNEAELTQMIEKLEPIVNDSLATITEITIYGMASADGSLPFNTTLSANRALSAKRWLSERLKLSPTVQNLIKTGSRPEGWQPVLEAMTRLGHADSVKVKDILERYADKNDDVQEYYIRRLSCWPFIRENCLQKDRKVDYTYAWVIRSFTTDQELINMYQTRPDAFNEPELLRVAQLAADDDSRMQVYRYVLTRYPQSQVALNNLAILLERNGQIEEAYKLLGKEPVKP